MSLHELVEQAAKTALETSMGHLPEAVERMAIAVRGDAKLYAALTRPHVAELCLAALRTVQATERAPREPRPYGPRASTEHDSGASIRALAAGNAAILLATVLPSGIVLEKATRGEVAAAADVYEAKEKRAGHKSRWLRLVAQCVPEDKTVGRALTERRLQELREEANRG